MAKVNRKQSPRRLKRLNLSAGRRLGKYRLDKRLGEGGSCEVWRARDCVEDIVVALKIPLIGVNGQRDNHQLFREIRLVSKLCHPNILRVKNADVVEDHVVLATELSGGTLADRSKPMAPRRIIGIMIQVLDGLAHAHRERVIHCDVNPMNIFLFPNGRAALGDFGISLRIRGRMETIDDFGTPGYVAPEQAYGRPTYSSDCFSAGLVLYEYLTGVLPRWPFRWPFRCMDRLQERTGASFVSFIKKTLHVDPAQRFLNGNDMLAALQEAIPKRLLESIATPIAPAPIRDWTRVRRTAYLRRYGKILGHTQHCCDCHEPIHESMHCCPWCASTRNRFQSTTQFTHICQRCTRGMLGEWSYCPWCYGPGYKPSQHHPTRGQRYHGTCTHCEGKLMRFMRYCPWCRHKIKTWSVNSFPEICTACKGPVDSHFWRHCPWCERTL